jgi:hypothetical protein
MKPHQRDRNLALAAKGGNVECLLTPYDLCLLSLKARQEARHALLMLRKGQVRAAYRRELDAATIHGDISPVGIP